MNRKFLFFFVLTLILSSFLLSLFPNNNRFYNLSSGVQAEHFVGVASNQNFIQLAIYSIMNLGDKVITKIDYFIPFFPSILRIHWWDTLFISFILLVPFIFIVSLISFKNRKMGIFLLGVFIIFLIPMSKIYSDLSSRIVISHRFDAYFPWSSKYIWIASSKDTQTSYTKYLYSWEQRKLPKKAEINLSCLGHYQLLVNGKRVYHGPVFGSLPEIYVDTIDIAKYINPGKNTIVVTCVYITGPTHEYPNYKSGALLVGGFVQDSYLYHNLADNRLWKFTEMDTVKPGDRIFDSGYQEKYDLTKVENFYKIPTNLFLNYQVLQRPIPLLSYKQIIPKRIGSSLYDLGSFSTGYLVIKSNQKAKCNLKINYGVNLDQDGFPRTYVRQEDKFILPLKEIVYEQISRRSGRYIGLEGDCDLDKISISFSRVFNNFSNDNWMPLGQLERAIYKISLNSLINDVQDHFEDSSDREKATYIGDSLQVSKCLLSLGKNDNLVKQTIIQFAKNQNKDGFFPSMAPSGVMQLIPSYSLQWASLLGEYLNESGDKKFAREMWPHLEKLLSWAKDNESSNGFFYNKHKQRNWWNFFDWTPTSQALEFQTQNQIWYLKALGVAEKTATLIGENADIYKKTSVKLKINLLAFAYDRNNEVFYDSFDKQNKDGISLNTNALAGEMNLFPDKNSNDNAIIYFKSNYFTQTPYSQSWVIDWLINSNKKELAMKIIEDYWGGMVRDDATSVYEKFEPNIYSPDDSIDSFSHAWGCGPVYEYRKIYK